MADEREHRVTLKYERGYEFVAEFHEPRVIPLLLLDEPKPLGEGLGPNAAALLGAAVANFLMIVKERGARVGLSILGFITPVSVLTGAGLNYVLIALGIRF